MSRTGVFETQIASDYKAFGCETVFPLSKWLWFIKDKRCVFLCLVQCPSHAVARGCCQKLLRVAADQLPERQVKTQLQGKLQSLDPGKLVFWPGCHGDRQAAAAREEGTAASPTSRILRQPWWGRGLDIALSLPDTEAPVCTPQLPDSQDLVSCQGAKGDMTALAPEPGFPLLGQFPAIRPQLPPAGFWSKQIF